MEWGVCGRETGFYTGMLASADHLHAHKPIQHYRKGKTQKKHNRAPLNSSGIKHQQFDLLKPME